DPGNRKSERSPDVRAACARALRHYRRTDVVAVLAEAVEDEKEDLLVRWHAHDSLVEIVGVDRGWARSDWEGDTKKLPPLPQPEKRWWEHILGLFARDGDNDETDGGEP
ncbi:MAG: HEAT repeat domain-containing protein, partial [Phycisphaerae bacterium]|nr:HEAT repeat domain-containing protein [Phycisphaerae bacterium]